jgi:hypothetical protein
VTKAQLQADIDYLKLELERAQQGAVYREREIQEGRTQFVAKLLIQERRELVARVKKLEVLIDLNGGEEDGGSPSRTVRR